MPHAPDKLANQPATTTPAARPKRTGNYARVRLNALRHGLTGHTVLLPGDDLARYRSHCARYTRELAPVGLLEEQHVQTLADTQWRLHRLRAIEQTLFTLDAAAADLTAHPDTTGAPAAPTHPALAALDQLLAPALSPADRLAAEHAARLAAAWQQRHQQLATLSLYEQRLSRLLSKTLAELHTLQADRRARAAAERRTAENQAFWESLQRKPKPQPPADDPPATVCSNPRHPAPASRRKPSAPPAAPLTDPADDPPSAA